MNELHDKAMEFAEQALLARRKGDEHQAEVSFRLAYDLEAEAAALIANDLSAEPTRSVLLRSAATLALDCGELREAEKLIATALIGNPPAEIADELRDLFEQVNARRRVEIR